MTAGLPKWCLAEKPLLPANLMGSLPKLRKEVDIKIPLTEILEEGWMKNVMSKIVNLVSWPMTKEPTPWNMAYSSPASLWRS
jgi:hypothetical protein